MGFTCTIRALNLDVVRDEESVRMFQIASSRGGGTIRQGPEPVPGLRLAPGQLSARNEDLSLQSEEAEF